MDINKIQAAYNQLVNIVNAPQWNMSVFAGHFVIPLFQDLMYISDNIGAEDSYLGGRVKDIASKLFLTNNMPVPVFYSTHVYTINVFCMGSILELLNTLLYQNAALSNNSATDVRVFKKIFISHQKNDYNQVLALMNLLYAIGIPRPTSNRENTVFCSSYPGSYLPNNTQNLDELKIRLNSVYDTFYIMWYTDNFFNSYACLNEAGAIWAKSAKYLPILAPNFDESRIGGLMGKPPILFRANDKYRLNLLKDDIEKMFALPSLPLNAWEVARDNFIRNITL